MISANGARFSRLFKPEEWRCEVDPHDPTRWIVTSDQEPKEGEEPETYLVDLHDFRFAWGGFNGSCTCKDFVFNKKPILEAGEDGGMPLRCKHIRRCRSLFADGSLAVNYEKKNWKRK